MLALISFAEPKICQDLFAEVCGNKKIITDPTGYSIHPGEAYQKKLAEKLKRFEAFLNTKISTTLADPKNKNMLKSFAGFAGIKNCESNFAKCLKKLTPTLASSLNPLDPQFPDSFDYGAFDSARDTVEISSFLKSINDDYKKFFVDSDFKSKAQKMLEDLKKIMIEKLDTLSLAPHRKKAMIDKLSATKLVDCWGLMPEDAIVNGNAANYFGYDSNVICIESGFSLQNTSMFNLAMALSHELTHTLDPCAEEFQIGIPKGVRSPWMPVMQCLRSADSVKANPSKRTLDCIVGDQIGESFADWMGLEITVDYVRRNYSDMRKNDLKNGWINMSRYSCDTRVGEHPAMIDRMNKLTLTHPEIRKDFGCTSPSKATYCPMDLMRQSAGSPNPSKGLQ